MYALGGSAGLNTTLGLTTTLALPPRARDPAGDSKVRVMRPGWLDSWPS